VDQTDLFESFPARDYLDKYYSYVGEENQAMMRALGDFVRRFEPRLERVVEVAGGPSVVPILSLCAATDRSPASVTFTDVSAKNMEEAELWLHDRPGAFGYSDILKWLAREHAVDAERIRQLARATSWNLSVVDLGGPLPASMLHAFDTVSSHFFAESATSDPDTLVSLLNGIARLGAPDARVFLSFMRRSTGYTVAGIDFPAIPVDEETLPDILDAAGLRLNDVKYVVTEAENPPTREGYEGMVFVAGVLPARRRESRRRHPARVVAGA
jgi:hypothetical protein